MILQSVKTELAAAPSSTPANAAQKSSGPGEANSRTRLNPRRLNLHIKRLNVEGLAPSEQGIFIAAFQARIDTLTQAAAQGEPWSHFVSGPRTSTIRRIDGGVLPSGLDARGMGERAASAIFRELLRRTPLRRPTFTARLETEPLSG
jgi:hypothetical protein